MLAEACICGKVFWCHKKFRAEIVKRKDYESDKEYRSAFRAQFGITASDVTAKKAKSLRGIKKSKKKGGWRFDDSK